LSGYLLIGSISGVSGLKGGLKVSLLTDFPERFSEGSTVFIDLNGFKKEFQIESFSPGAKNKSLVFLHGVENKEIASRLAGNDIYIPEERAREFEKLLRDDEFLFYDLLQCNVYLDKILFGMVTEVFEAGGGHILIVSHNGKEFQIPFVDEFVDTTKLNEKRIDIKPVEGLLDQ
jgi:16S rRNA processing protein RimM